MGLILVTGGAGLIGTALRRHLGAAGHRLRTFDTRAVELSSRGDIRDTDSLRRAVADCDGVVHLAAVARVAQAEREPALCVATNVDALRSVLQLALESKRHPRVLFASSREVYGQPSVLPVVEEARLAPINVYGRSKVDGERLCGEARQAGLRTAVVRLSNVYGSTGDHADRVIPAFLQAAIAGRPLQLHGPDCALDFTHVDDVADGLTRVVDALTSERLLPPIHLTSGVPTSLEELAALVIGTTGTSAVTEHAPARRFDVRRFVGDPTRAHALLGWQATTSLTAGVARLAAEFTSEASVR